MSNIDSLYQDIRQLIEVAKSHVTAQVNQTLVLIYWQIGKTIKTELLHDDRSEYGLAILKQLAQQLQQEYGVGFSYSSLTVMAEVPSLNRKKLLPDGSLTPALSQRERVIQGIRCATFTVTRMVKFYGFMPEQTIVATLSQQFKAMLEAKSRLEFHRVGGSDG